MSQPAPHDIAAAVIGGGPAGLMAAERLAARGIDTHVFDAMPSVGRKFLMAGKGGMNITHSEPLARFITRYGAQRDAIAPLLDAFGPDALRDWIHGLGIDTFIGSSGRVFPTDFKAAPLLRAWLRRLRESGVTVHVRHRWQGWRDDGALRFHTPDGPRTVRGGVTVLALGGASWARLGSDGAWAAMLRGRGLDVTPFRPANCGFDVAGGWSPVLRARFAGAPVKPVALSFGGETRRGELVLTETGLEGGLVYAFSARLRDAIEAAGQATLHLDLAPDRSEQHLAAALKAPRGSRSLSSHLKKRAGIAGVKAALLREVLDRVALEDPVRVAAAVKALPVTLAAPRPLDEAISTAGGVPFSALREDLMLRALPGVFCAGEMVDWEAPTGGYLLTACFATGRRAGDGAARWLRGE